VEDLVRIAVRVDFLVWWAIRRVSAEGFRARNVGSRVVLGSDVTNGFSRGWGMEAGVEGGGVVFVAWCCGAQVGGVVVVGVLWA